MVSAWASANQLVLGQVKTEEKSNEITAIPALLRLLAIKGCIVTIDAMGCQTEIATQIIGQGGDYVFALKGNQTTLHEEVKSFFEDATLQADPDLTIQREQTTDGDHGRVEIGRYRCTSDISWLDEPWERGQKRPRGTRAAGGLIRDVPSTTPAYPGYPQCQ